LPGEGPISTVWDLAGSVVVWNVILVMSSKANVKVPADLVELSVTGSKDLAELYASIHFLLASKKYMIKKRK